MKNWAVRISLFPVQLISTTEAVVVSTVEIISNTQETKSQHNAIIVFVRNPVLGNVKTRLAATLGAEKALAIYKFLLDHTHRVSREVAADKFIFYEDFVNDNDIWENTVYQKMLQQGTDLGTRMANAFDALFRKNYSAVVIIGSDCYELTSTIITDAFEALSKNEVVIGPAKDGGYYLLGMNHLIPGLFRNKKWSTNSVYSDTVSQLKTLGKRFYQLPLLSDVDEESDITFDTNEITPGAG